MPTADSNRTHRVMAIAGTGLVLAGAMLAGGALLRGLLVVPGLVLLNARFFPAPWARHEPRRFLTLRNEVDDFIRTVRRLNALGAQLQREDSTEAAAEFESGCEELVARAEHIGQLAWREHADLAEGRLAGTAAAQRDATSASR